MARGFVPPPPVTAATVCRWCGWKRVQIIVSEGEPWLCPRGCAGNDQAPYWGQCGDCRREYQTGYRAHGGQCWQCAAKELAQYAAAYCADAPCVKHTGYEHDRRKAGANRRVIEALPKGDAA